MFRFSTQMKVAAGFAALLLLILLSAGLVYHEMSASMTNDEQQLRHIDSVKVLLAQKEKRIGNAVRTLELLEPAKRNAVRTVAVKDTAGLTPVKSRKRIVITQQYAVSGAKKGFFRRLHDVFAKSRPDTAQISKTIVTETVDTVLKGGDSLNGANARAWNKYSAAVDVEHSKKIRRLNRQIRNLKSEDSALDAQIVGLLKEIESGDSIISGLQTENLNMIRHNSVQTLGWISIAALLSAGAFLFVIWRDIKRNEQYRRRLEKANGETSRLLEEREQMMLTVTHDIKAPLGSILGYADLLERITEDERQRQYLDNMKVSGQHLLCMVTSLLDFHRLDENKVELEILSFRPATLFNAICRSFLPQARKKDIRLEYVNGVDADKSYDGDAFRIRQIADNLLSNALKFTDSGSVRLSVDIKKGKLHFSVSDTGSGIPEKEKQKIFREFTRLSNAQGHEGFGLGLSITLKLVKLMNGEISVDSEQGKGTVFDVLLPLRATERHETEKNTATSLRLLMIDDDPLQLKFTEAMLRHRNITLTTCAQPLKLLELLRQNEYDAVVTDIQMPAMNGLELIREIRDAGFPLPVYALTARSDITIGELRKHGFDGCLHKPFTAEELEMTLRGIPHEGLPAEEMPSSVQPDFSALTVFSGDDKDAAVAILKTFVSEARNNRNMLDLAVKKEDVSRISALAHKMLPVFIQIKAGGCVPALTWLEQCGNIVMNESVKREAETVLAGSAELADMAETFLEKM
jgi:signal transduction histidine kinase/CheY-like chemotaxis protein